MGKQWTNEQIKQLVADVESNELTWREIADKLGRTVAACKSKYGLVARWRWRDRALDRSNEDMRA